MKNKYHYSKFFKSILILGIICLQHSFVFASKDTLFFQFGTLKLYQGQYFELDTNYIKEISIVKDGSQPQIYGNPKGGLIKIDFYNEYFDPLKLEDIINIDLFDFTITKTFINNIQVPYDSFLNQYVKDYSFIEFVNTGDYIKEIRLSGDE